MSDLKIFKAANVEQAVEMAIGLKEAGEYDLFRGQVCDWPPHSSLFRLEITGDNKKILEHNESTYRFYNWLDRTPELRHLAKDENTSQVTAIMQHYGIKTNYIDFTTDPPVAGFFAGDTATPPVTGQACIYCLNSQDLIDMCEGLEEDINYVLKIIQVDVSNLWRLQSQKGVFVFSNYNWESLYPMDKIVFPYSGYPSYPPKETIYPVHKSHLEQLLDQYFANEASITFNKMMIGYFAELKKQGKFAEVNVIKPFYNYVDANAFIDAGSLSHHPSWNDAALEAWNVVTNEVFDDTVGTFETIILKAGASSEEAAGSIRFAIKQVIAKNNKQRSKAIEWVFKNLPAGIEEEQLKFMFNLAWNGMRRLPYTNEEIATCLSNIFLLLSSVKDNSPSSNQVEAAHNKLFGAGIEVGFTVQDFSDSRGFASNATLNDAMRTDLQQLLTQEYSTYPGNPNDVFRIIYNSRILFDFEKLKKLFAEQLIPTQIVLKRNPVIYNPARVIVMGNP